MFKLLFFIIFYLLNYSLAEDSCKNRGELDVLYCDENQDLVADTPSDSVKLKNPKNLVFSFTPVENPAVYEELFQPFILHLSQCTGRKVSFHQVQSNAAEVEAMRSGRLHIGGFSTGSTTFAVNNAGAIPFAAEGYSDGSLKSYRLFVIVKHSSSYKKLSDLKGKKVAHSSPSSNAGHMAPLAFFPKEGLVPDKDYKILFSGKYDQSIMGVKSGDYDAAAVTSDVYLRMIERNQIEIDDFRIIFKSQKFPPGPYTFAYNLEPKLQEKIKECFYNFSFTEEMKTVFEQADRFVPITYKKDWEIIREIAKASKEK